MAEKIVIEIDLERGDVSGATDAIAKAGGEAGEKAAAKLKKALKKDISGDIKSISASVAKATAAVTALGGAIATGLAVKGVRAAQAQEDAVNSLNSALSISNNASLEASKGIQEYASELQKSTRFGDEALLQNAALIQSLGDLSEQGLKDATKATADLATALRVDLNTAAVLVGKAASGNVSSFSRYGLAIQKGANNAETFANALEAINTKFGGAAERDVNTYSGAVQQLENSFGDLFEEIGFLITKNPAFIQTLKTTTGFLVDAGKSVNEFAKGFDLFDAITGTLINFNKNFITYVVAPFELLLNVAKIVQSGLNNFFAEAINRVANFGSSIAFVLDKLGIGEKVSNELKIFKEATQETANETGQAVRDAIENVFNFSVSDKLDQSNEELASFFEEQKAIAEAAAASNQEAQNIQVQQAQETAMGISDVFSSIGDGFTSGVGQITDKIADVNAHLKKFSTDAGKTLQKGLGQGAGQAFAAFGAAVVSGENALEAFAKSLFKSIGQQAVALGTRFILEGAAMIFSPNPQYQAQGPGLIKAGAALAAFGGAIGASAGGGASGAGGGGGAAPVSGTAQAEANTAEELATPDTENARQVGSNVEIVVQGSLVQQEELGQFITETLNDNFEKQGLTLTDARFT